MTWIGDALKEQVRLGLKFTRMQPKDIKDDAAAILFIVQRGGNRFLTVKEMVVINDILDELQDETRKKK